MTQRKNSTDLTELLLKCMADQNALAQMKQIAKDQVDQLEQHLICAFTVLPSRASAKVK